MLNKVLVFESDPAFAGELRTEFGNLGCTVSVVDDGNVGLQQAAVDKPDLILLSIELPRMNGFSVCNKLKKDAKLKDVPLIIMSSESSEETFDQHKKLRTRAEDYVHKPIAFGELLEHVQQFVSVGDPAVATDSAIVIDDEIEVGSSDYLLDDAAITEDVSDLSELEVEPAVAGAAQGGAGSAEVETIAESAFERLTDFAPADAHSAQNGSVAQPSVSQPSSMGRASQRPLAYGAEVVRDPFGEPGSSRERLDAAERELEEARRELERLRIDAADAGRAAREIDELRAKLAAGTRAGGAASREFLDLREALNKKDKDILAYKEQLSKKDREIVEAKERALSLERTTADVEERLLAVERELAATHEKGDGLAAETEAAKRTNEELRGRLERLRVENDAKERQLSELRAKQADERAAIEMKVGALRAEADHLVANERAEHARALDQAEQRRGADLEHARRERDTAVTDARDQATREIEALRGQQASELRAVEESRDARIAALETNSLRELGEARARSGELESELSIARRELQSLAEAKRLDDEAHDARIAAVQKRLLDVQSARDDLEQKLSVVTAKRDSDKRSLERAKDALAVALAQIEETESL
jgi:DNA-binding response OmpR family regulator/chromosome segregation ATPase